MKIKTNEIYERYYSAVAGRFYTSGEKRRLLALFAQGFGVNEGSFEFSEIHRTAEAVERLAIETLVDCNNFLLIADSIPGRREIVKAVRAQKSYLEKAKSSGAVTYYNLLDWRTGVFKSRNDDPVSKLEAAYIDYARGSVDTAIKYFEEVAAKNAHLLSVEHLAFIYRERGKTYESLVKFLILDEVVNNVLAIGESELFARLIEEAESLLADEFILAARKEAAEEVKRHYSYGAISRNTIGFRR